MEPENSDRFLDPGTTLSDFLDQVLVVCPRCKAQAYVEPERREQKAIGEPHRLTCPHCAYVQVGSSHSWGLTNEERDPFFGRPLWLQIGCRGGVLWAYNYRHLSLTEAYVRARLRERVQGPDDRSEKSAVSQLPPWIKSAKNRAQVLRCIEKLKEKG
jgi:hypothetical protein